MRKLEQRFHQLRKVVLGLSGGHEEVLALIPSERARFESLGWAILITSGVATVSMWFALANAVGINGILALPIALGWGLVIMGIDRWLIISMPIKSRRKFAMAVPRLALALLLGTLISTPLVLRIFQSEINAEISKMQQQNYSSFLQQQQASDVAKQVGTFSGELQYLNNVIATKGATTANTASDPELKGYNGQLANLDSELTHWTNLKSQYYQDYICQLYGGPSCPKKGFGPAAKDSQKNYQQASQEVDTLKGQINQVQGKIQQRDGQLTSNSKASQQARYQQALTHLPIVKNEYDTALQRQNELQASFFATNQAAHGILIRLEALSQLSKGNFTVTAARFLLFLLFLVIECLPVTVKLLQQPGLYEEALMRAQEAERRDFNKFFRFRSRLTGPSGTAFLWSSLAEGPDQRVIANWTPPRALPGSVISVEDQPTEALDDDSASSWNVSGDRPARSQVSPGAPEHRWYGPDGWRNHWYDEGSEDDEPQAFSRDEEPDPADSEPDPGDGEIDPQYGPPAEPPADDGSPDDGETRAQSRHRKASWDEVHQGDEGGVAYGTDGYRIQSFEDEGPPVQGHTETGRRVDWDNERPDGHVPASAARPGISGTQLNWEDEEE